MYVTLADEAAAPASWKHGSRAWLRVAEPLMESSGHREALTRTVTDVMQQAKVYTDLGFDVADVDLTGLQAAAAGWKQPFWYSRTRWCRCKS